MAEKKQTPKVLPSVRQPVLNVKHKEAVRLIEQQLEEGRRILQSATERKITTVKQLNSVSDELWKWDQANSALLRYSIFSIPSFADKYGELPTPEKAKSLTDYASKLDYFYRTRKRSLESIKAQLPLFDIAPGPVSATDGGVIDKKNVVVVYGRNEKLKDSMFNFLAAIGLKPLDWIQLKTAAIKSTGKGTPYTGEIVANAFGQRAVLVLLTGDDKAILRKKFWKKNDPPYERELTPQARPNVLFEAGMAIGRSDERTILVEIGTVRQWTDIAGRHVTRFDGSPQKRQELVEELKAVGCEVDTSGSHWMDVGDFEEEPDSQESNRSSEESITARGKGASTQRSRRPHVESKIKIGRAENTKVTGVDYSGISSTPSTESAVQIDEIKGGEATGVQSKETDNQVKG